MTTELLVRPTAATANPTPTPTTTTTPTPPRVDLYAAIHKALRLAMSDTLVRTGCFDVRDDAARAEAMAQVHMLCAMCRAHVAKENTYVHPAIEARRPGGSGRIAGEHEEHLVAIDALEAAADAVEAEPTQAMAHRLYRQLAGFVAENYEHMDVEESVHNTLLWTAYTDAELLALHEHILAGIPPEEMAQVLHWMLPALSHAERLGMLADMRGKAPPPAFAATLKLAQARLPASEWLKLATALDLG